ncbi:tryptophan synthetase [Aspergillus nanangensis]|uniref:tryptophan synthase n=1 Tax=Aspergillus nanangensis TaxID=2582783 RepID=A0AAD4CQ77_ASPNN|nr:tryptophan synthetase [Aspergillus nanangensis]
MSGALPSIELDHSPSPGRSSTGLAAYKTMIPISLSTPDDFCQTITDIQSIKISIPLMDTDGTYRRDSPRAGRFGEFGGRYAPEGQIGFLDELDDVFHSAVCDGEFWEEFRNLTAGPPTPLDCAEGLTRLAGGARIWLKRKDHRRSGSMNGFNIAGQVLLARRMHRTEIVADCGSLSHGVECATVCAQMGLQCTVVVGEKDAQRQPDGVREVRRLGAAVTVVATGCMTLRAALFWGRSVCDQLPTAIVAPVGGIGAGLGLFHPFVQHRSVRLLGVESASAAALSHGSRGVFHGMCTHILQDRDGQIMRSLATAPDLNYPAVGPELAAWKQGGRIECVSVVDDAAVRGVKVLEAEEEVMAGLDTGLAVETTLHLARSLGPEDNIVLLVTSRV